MEFVKIGEGHEYKELIWPTKKKSFVIKETKTDQRIYVSKEEAIELALKLLAWGNGAQINPESKKVRESTGSFSMHMGASIIGMLENYRRQDMSGLVLDDNGNPMDDHKARMELYKELQKGRTLLMMTGSKECPDFDYTGGGCPGHKSENKNK